MVHPLDGARLKVERAFEHLKTVNTETAAFFDTQPYPIGVEQEADDRWRVVLHVRREVPAHLAVGFGDAVHNVRSALDHLAYALAASPTRNTQWPICDTEASWKSALSKKYLKGIDPAHHAAICDRQPYRDVGKYHWLSTLRDLDDADKHRVLQYAAAWPSQAELLIPVGLTGQAPPTTVVKVEEGAILCRMVGRPATPTVKMEVKATVGYQVNFGPPPDGINTRNLLEIAYLVLEIIDSFVPVFP